jgi:hypothetical protein
MQRCGQYGRQSLLLPLLLPPISNHMYVHVIDSAAYPSLIADATSMPTNIVYTSDTCVFT